jgi:hypothetical protein
MKSLIFVVPFWWATIISGTLKWILRRGWISSPAHSSSLFPAFYPAGKNLILLFNSGAKLF